MKWFVSSRQNGISVFQAAGDTAQGFPSEAGRKKYVCNNGLSPVRHGVRKAVSGSALLFLCLILCGLLSVCAAAQTITVSSTDELEEVLWPWAKLKTTEFSIYGADGYDPVEDYQSIASCLHGCGAADMQIFNRWGYLSVQDIVYDEQGVLCESVQDVRTNISSFKASGTRAFHLYLRSALYHQLTENNFAMADVLERECGIESRTLHYRTNCLLYSEVQYSELPLYTCSSQEDILRALTSSVLGEQDTCQILVTEELYHSCYEEGLLFALAAQVGIEDCRLVGWERSRIIAVQDITLFSVPFWFVDDSISFLHAMEMYRESGYDTFALVLAPSFYREITQTEDDRLTSLIFYGQLRRYQFETNGYSCMVKFENAEFSDSVRISCSTESELLTAIRQFAASGITGFDVLLTRNLYDKVAAQDFGRLWELTADAGMKRANLSYSAQSCILYFTDAQMEAEAKRLTTVEEARETVRYGMNEGLSEITLFLSQELYDTLMLPATQERHAAGREDELTAGIYDLAAEGGMLNYSIVYNETGRFVTFESIRYYAGVRILHAWRNKAQEQLTARERRVLELALAMAERAGIAGGEAARQWMQDMGSYEGADGQWQQETLSRPGYQEVLEVMTALSLHDQLCEHISYHIDPLSEEDDTATGALLNGQANCDGYADAFYLTGTLAGLDIRFQQGISKNQDTVNPVSEGGHMWNLIRIGDTWRMVDVTWDDGENYISHRWFNAGMDRASRTHMWNEQFTEALLMYTDWSIQPPGQYRVVSEEDMEMAAGEARDLGLSCVELFFEGEALAESREDFFDMLRWRGVYGTINYSWYEELLCLIVFDF